jgi:hypothetical protein
MERILELLAAGLYLPALALALLAITALVRKGFFDAVLQRLAAALPGDDGPQLTHLRAWIPITLAGVAWVICVLLPWDVSATEAAYTALLTAITAMAGHDASKAVGALLLAIMRWREGRGAPPPPAGALRGDQ